MHQRKLNTFQQIPKENQRCWAAGSREARRRGAVDLQVVTGDRIRLQTD